MKKIFTLIALIFVLQTASKAQGNLQFNAVKIVEVTNANNYNGGSLWGYYTYNHDTTFTIPVGKVWKIESASTSYFYPTSNSLNNFQLLSIDGKFIYGSNVYSGTLPMWLPDGIHNIGISTTSPSFKGAISAIEYNIIP